MVAVKQRKRVKKKKKKTLTEKLYFYEIYQGYIEYINLESEKKYG